MGKVLAWIRSNGFLFGLIGMVGLAWLLPEPGAQGGLFMSGMTRRWAVFIIFLVQGLNLPTEELRRGLGQWPLHSFVLFWNYLGFPIFVFGLLRLLGSVVLPEIAFGFLYLAILPTTITSAVFFTSSAEGDVAGSVFSTAISNLLSVFLVPLGAALLLFEGGAASLEAMFLKLCQLIVLPMALGQLLRPLFKHQLSGMKPWFKRITTGAIFYIMYCTFCDGVISAAWETLGWGAVFISLSGALLVLISVAGMVWWTSRSWKGKPATRIAAFFCASQKSLATGVPMAASIFPASGALHGIPDVSVIVIPLMCYHILQLVLAARLADRFRGARPNNR